MSLPPRDYRDRLYQSYLHSQLRMTRADARGWLDREQPYLKKIAHDFLPQDRSASILDIGCGIGSFLFTLKALGYANLAGVDASAEQVGIAREMGLDCIVQGDLREVVASAPAGSYDVVAALDVLEHFGKDEVLLLLDQVHRVLKPGGCLIAHVPNGEAIFPGRVFFGDFTHQTAFTQRSIAQVAACCGFSTVTCHEDRPVVHGPMSAARAVVWRLVRVVFRVINAAETGDYRTGVILSQNLLAVCRK